MQVRESMQASDEMSSGEVTTVQAALVPKLQYPVLKWVRSTSTTVYERYSESLPAFTENARMIASGTTAGERGGSCRPCHLLSHYLVTATLKPRSLGHPACWIVRRERVQVDAT